MSRIMPDGQKWCGLDGLLLEPTRTNYLRYSGEPRSQAVELGSGTYVLWVHGCRRLSWATVGGNVGFMVRRSWRERLFSWPWTPWRRQRRHARDGRWVVFRVQERTTVAVKVRGGIRLFQVEDARFPTSYIPTVSAPVTRPGDVLSFGFEEGAGR